jgi:hypothetical protein
MKVCLVFPEGDLFGAPLQAVREALAAHEMAQVWPKALDSQSCDDLERCNLVIADVTGRNPNVLYFVGWADALKKRTILLASFAEDFPFESHREKIIYARDAEFLKEELGRRLSEAGASSAEAAACSDAEAKEKFYAIFGDLLKKHGQEHHGGVEMENEKTFLLTNQEFDLALVQDMARRGRELGLRIKLL